MVFVEYFSTRGLSRFFKRFLPATFKDTQEVGLLHDQQFLAIDLDLVARPFPEQNELARSHFGSDAPALVVQGAGANCNHFALLGLLLCGIGDDDPAGGFLIFGKTANDHAVAQWAKFHGTSSPELTERHARESA